MPSFIRSWTQSPFQLSILCGSMIKRGYLKGSEHRVAQLTDTVWHLRSGQGIFGLQTLLGYLLPTAEHLDYPSLPVTYSPVKQRSFYLAHFGANWSCWGTSRNVFHACSGDLGCCTPGWVRALGVSWGREQPALWARPWLAAGHGCLIHCRPALVKCQYELPQNREVFGIQTSF